MNFTEFLTLALSNPTNISIEYSNIDGKETLLVNGKEVKDEFDDTHIKEIVDEYKDRIEVLDDDIFVEAMEEAGEELDLTEVDTLLNQEHYSETEAETINRDIDIMDSIISNTIQSRINSLTKIKELFI